MPEISVIMGIYNENRKQAAQAITSILNQTLKDFEFIICDDGSGTEFYQWLQRYCGKDARIRLLRNKENKGLAFALNRCLSCASGKYIARMDADDRSKADRLEKQAAFLRLHTEYALVGSSVLLADRHGVWGKRRLEKEPQRESFLNTSPFVHPSVMIRREVMDRLHGYCESPAALRAEDYELFMRLYASGFCGYNLPEALLVYREDIQAYAKRRYRFRIRECAVRYAGFRRLGILKGNFLYVVKPLAVGMIPARIMALLRRKRYGIGRNDRDRCIEL